MVSTPLPTARHTTRRTSSRKARKRGGTRAGISRRQEAGAEVELLRLATELHDRVAQSLWCLDAELAQLARSLPDEPAAARARLDPLRELIGGAYRDVRLAIGALRTRPPIHQHLAQALARQLEAFSRQTGIDVRISSQTRIVRLPKLVELQLLAIIQQALANVRQHSGATTVTLSFEERDGGWVLEIQDNGCGLVPDTVSGPHCQAHFGLSIMDERARSFGGSVSISSQAGGGSVVSVHIPRAAVHLRPSRGAIRRSWRLVWRRGS